MPCLLLLLLKLWGCVNLWDTKGPKKSFYSFIPWPSFWPRRPSAPPEQGRFIFTLLSLSGWVPTGQSACARRGIAPAIVCDLTHYLLSLFTLLTSSPSPCFPLHTPLLPRLQANWAGALWTFWGGLLPWGTPYVGMMISRRPPTPSARAIHSLLCTGYGLHVCNIDSTIARHALYPSGGLGPGGAFTLLGVPSALNNATTTACCDKHFIDNP